MGDLANLLAGTATAEAIVAFRTASNLLNKGMLLLWSRHG